MTRAFPKRIDSLDAIFGFLSGFAQAHQVNPAILRELNFGVEEIFTNMVKYNPETANDVTVNVDIANGCFSVSLLDHDVHSFDPTQSPPVDITQPPHERTPGGLGIHLVKEMMDEVLYEYADRSAKVTLIKHLEK